MILVVPDKSRPASREDLSWGATGGTVGTTSTSVRVSFTMYDLRSDALSFLFVSFTKVYKSVRKGKGEPKRGRNG